MGASSWPRGRSSPTSSSPPSPPHWRSSARAGRRSASPATGCGRSWLPLARTADYRSGCAPKPAISSSIAICRRLSWCRSPTCRPGNGEIEMEYERKPRAPWRDDSRSTWDRAAHSLHDRPFSGCSLCADHDQHGSNTIRPRPAGEIGAHASGTAGDAGVASPRAPRSAS
jgi:hypothetical protein